MARGIIFDIKEMSVNDGPGVRTTIFLKGCPLRCNWCHNPEGFTLSSQVKEAGPSCSGCGKCRRSCGHRDCRPHGRCLHACPFGRLSLCGREVESAALAPQVKRQAPFLMENGGVTISGGEPLMQPEFLPALMEELKPLHVAVETCAHAGEDVFRAMLDRADLVLADIKHMDDETHRRYTGVGNRRILANLGILKESGKPFIARVPVIPGVNDSAGNLEKTAEFLKEAKQLIRVELMPYNTLAGAKYRAMGLEYSPAFDENARPNTDCAPFISRGMACLVL